MTRAMGAWRTILVLGSLALAAVGAKAVAAPDPAPSWRWNVDYGEQRCSLVRLDQPARSTIFAVLTVPGSANWHARLIARRWPSGALANADRLTVTLQPGNIPLTAVGRRVEHTPSGEAMVMYLNVNPLDALPAARSVRVERGGETIMEIPLADTVEAVAAMRQCLNEVLHQWGIDPAIYARVREPLGGGRQISSVVSDADYPSSAIRANQSGEVVVRLTIGTDGRVSECAAVVSSGHAILDERTCTVFRQRLQMTPAIGMDGAPMAVPLTTAVRWILPRN
jgi:TonB family protein